MVGATKYLFWVAENISFFHYVLAFLCPAPISLLPPKTDL